MWALKGNKMYRKVKQIDNDKYANDDESLRIERNPVTANWELLIGGMHVEKCMYITHILIRNNIEIDHAPPA